MFANGGHAPLSLSDRPPDARSRRAAALVVAVSALVFLGLVGLAGRPLGPAPWFIPLFQAGLIINDLVTAALLFSQLSVTRRWASLVLASGFVYSALMACMHLLSFPGVFSPGGLLGAGAQSTGYLHVFWHLGIPTAVMGYAILRERGTPLQLPVGSAIWAGLSVVVLMAAGLTLLATRGEDLLPPMLEGQRYASQFNIGRYGQWAATALAFAVLWRRRARSVLDLWLLVMLCDSFFEIALVSIYNSGRYDLGFYAGRGYALLASAIVLLSLIAEQGKLYRELAEAQETARIETALRESREEELQLLQSAVARQNDILVITEGWPVDDPVGPRIVYVNNAFERRTGYSREEAIGRTPRMLQGPGTDRAELRRIREALLRWEPVRTELLNYTKSGVPYWIELDIAPMSDGSGKHTHWVAVERDVSARKDAEQRARIHEERFLLLARATNDILWDWDLTSGTVWWNEAFETVLGYKMETVPRGRESWTALIHPEDRPRVVEAIRKVIEGTGTHWEAEYRTLSAAGEVHDLMDRGFVIRNHAGSAVRVIGSMTDVTERRRLEGQLRQAQRLDAIGQLTGGVAHDFNNLLTVILGNAELLTEALADDPSLGELVQTTMHAAVRGTELTSRLLAFARKQALHPAPTDIAKLLQGMQGLLGRTLGGHLEIEWMHEPGLWPALVDASQLEAAILNICINARDAMPCGGRLTLQATNVSLQDPDPTRTPGVVSDPDLASGDYVLIRVTDTGVGMDEATLARAFEPFFTTKEVGKGSGLGLSMVYGFAKQSQGHLAIESSLGLGTVVNLYLPRAVGQPPVSSARQPHAVHKGRETILVVEDDDLVRGHVASLLQSLGYEVHAVAHAREALGALQLRSYQLLFTDVVMPGGMDGWELAREAHKLRPGLPVLFTSGYSDEAADDSAEHKGVRLLRKPYRRQELASRIRLMLDREPADMEPARSAG